MKIEAEPIFFPSQYDFREWLAKYHDTKSEVIVGYYKVNTGKPSMSWSESVDQALCFGWIDGIRKSIDNESYLIRFTPRNPKSIWSAINSKKVEDLLAKGLMMPAGIAIFNKRKDENSAVYSYERDTAKLSDNQEELFKSNVKAWEYFTKMPASYQKTALYWVLSARQESTRNKRLHELICDSEAQKKIKALNY